MILSWILVYLKISKQMIAEITRQLELIAWNILVATNQVVGRHGWFLLSRPISFIFAWAANSVFQSLNIRIYNAYD